MAQDIGDRLREARKAKGLSLASVAERIGATEGGVRHHENGTRAPSAIHVAAYSKLYTVSTDWLILGRGRGPGDKGADIVEIFDHIPDRDRPRVIEIMKTFETKRDKA